MAVRLGGSRPAAFDATGNRAVIGLLAASERGALWRYALGAICMLIVPSTAVAREPMKAWAKSPEAYFLTREERDVWNRLGSEHDRSAFVIRYWKRLDSSPETEQNEFKRLVLARIAAADERFSLGKKPGSRTARGEVFIVLGPPGVERQTVGPLQTAPVVVAPGRLALPREALDRTEWHVWVYDRERTPAVLDVLGRSSAEIAFIVAPGRRDHIQSSSLFALWRESIAQRSILNP